MKPSSSFSAGPGRFAAILDHLQYWRRLSWREFLEPRQPPKSIPHHQPCGYQRHDRLSQFLSRPGYRLPRADNAWIPPHYHRFHHLQRGGPGQHRRGDDGHDGGGVRNSCRDPGEDGHQFADRCERRHHHHRPEFLQYPLFRHRRRQHFPGIAAAGLLRHRRLHIDRLWRYLEPAAAPDSSIPSRGLWSIKSPSIRSRKISSSLPAMPTKIPISTESQGPVRSRPPAHDDRDQSRHLASRQEPPQL